MVSALGLIGLAVVVLVHTFLAATATRFFRLQLNTTWGRALFAAVFVPLLLFVSTLVLSGALGLGGEVGRTGAILLVFVVPLVLGYSIDLFWIPAPEEIELPDTEES